MPVQAFVIRGSGAGLRRVAEAVDAGVFGVAATAMDVVLELSVQVDQPAAARAVAGLVQGQNVDRLGRFKRSAHGSLEQQLEQILAR
jgi:hypothetical protein